MDLREGILQRRSAVAYRLSPYRLRPVEMPQRHIIKSLQNGDIHLVESPDGNLLRLALDRPRHKLMGNQNVADVMDGRDIGTVVFPDAELKIFVTASAAIRAQRRYDELRSKGQEASYEKILENVEERDRIDQTREVSPLRQADDAILLDNSHMSIAEQKKWLTEKFQAAING